MAIKVENKLGRCEKVNSNMNLRFKCFNSLDLTNVDIYGTFRSSHSITFALHLHLFKEILYMQSDK
jgi:hypothetical protein